MKWGFVIALFLAVHCFSQQRLDGRSHPFPVEIGKLKNVHEINEELYRSDQPSRSDFKELERIGIRTVISLRSVIGDARKLKETNIQLISIPMRTRAISFGHVVEVLKAMSTCERPLLIHCRRGIDRTGCMIAFYRMVFHDWSREQAIKEFLSEEYGYSKTLFPSVLELLRSMDLKELKDVLSD